MRLPFFHSSFASFLLPTFLSQYDSQRQCMVDLPAHCRYFGVA